MLQAYGFKPCSACNKPMPIIDLDDSCLKCLGEAHQTDRCKIYRAFWPRTKKEHDFHLKQLLMESALRPQLAADLRTPAPGTSVQSAPASVCDTVPRKDSSTRDPWHRRFPASHPGIAAPYNLTVLHLAAPRPLCPNCPFRLRLRQRPLQHRTSCRVRLQPCRL